MMKYIYEFYLSRGISPEIITAIICALIGTIAVLGAFMLQRAFLISQEMKKLDSSEVSEEQWDETVYEVMRKHKIIYMEPLILVSYITLFLVNYLMIIVLG